MGINACLYDVNGILQGSITDSALKKFQEEWDALYLKYRESKYFNILSMMNKSLRKSQENITADFLNCLKIIVRKYKGNLGAEFLKDVSKSYHNLVRYCCSNNVYQEVFDETINCLRNSNIDYKGKDVQGVEDEYCAFESEGLTVGIKIRNKHDLYSLWDNKSNNQIQAIVYAGDRKYIIMEKSLCKLITVINACIYDYKYSVEQECTIEQIAQELFDIAEKIYNNKGFC